MTLSITSRGFMCSRPVGRGKTHPTLTDAREWPQKGGSDLDTRYLSLVPLSPTGSGACVGQTAWQHAAHTEVAQ